MAQIENINWDLKRFYLHIDTVTNGFDAWIALQEVKELQQLNANNEQNYELFIIRNGKVPKDNADPNIATKFTPRFVSFLTGWRAVPYPQDHKLDILVEMISDDGLTDRDMFDRSTITNNVDIDSVYQQVEIIVGNGMTPEQFRDGIIQGLETLTCD